MYMVTFVRKMQKAPNQKKSVMRHECRNFRCVHKKIMRPIHAQLWTSDNSYQNKQRKVKKKFRYTCFCPTTNTRKRWTFSSVTDLSHSVTKSEVTSCSKKAHQTVTASYIQRCPVNGRVSTLFWVLLSIQPPSTTMSSVHQTFRFAEDDLLTSSSLLTDDLPDNWDRSYSDDKSPESELFDAESANTDCKTSAVDLYLHWEAIIFHV